VNVADAEDIYHQIYVSDHWQGGSGPGSTADASAEYRRILQRLLASTEIRRVVDVGCGDWQVGSLLDWSGIDYTGIDVVSSVVEADQTRFGAANVRFQVADARSADLPPAELLLIKDVLQHWPSADVQRFLSNTLPRYRYALITNDIASRHFTGELNQDIEMGSWRTLDLQAPPFGLTARAHWDYDIRGEWTKRVLLVGNTARWRVAGAIPRSVRRIARSI
jgi:SAM-dependent methyltransferase